MIGPTPAVMTFDQSFIAGKREGFGMRDEGYARGTRTGCPPAQVAQASAARSRGRATVLFVRAPQLPTVQASILEFQTQGLRPRTAGREASGSSAWRLEGAGGNPPASAIRTSRPALAATGARTTRIFRAPLRPSASRMRSPRGRTNGSKLIFTPLPSSFTLCL